MAHPLMELFEAYPLTRKEAARYLNLSASTLARYACYGVGPRYYRGPSNAAGVIYYKADLDAWREANWTEVRPVNNGARL